MTTRPHPLPGWAIKALDEERLTQWRWRLKVQPQANAELEKAQDGVAAFFLGEDAYSCDRMYRLLDLPIKPGMRLWVQETWARVPRTAYLHSDGIEQTDDPSDPDMAAIYKHGFDRCRGGFGWRSPVTMPRWASRWTLTVESVRVERCRDVTIHDAEAEGVLWAPGDHSRKESYAREWERRHGPGAWERDWCAVATISAERRNVDG